MDIDSTREYRPMWTCLQILAPPYFGHRSRVSFAYMAFLHLLVTVLFPLHLIIGLSLPSAPEKQFQNLTMSIVCTACSLKALLQIYNVPQMLEIEKLLLQLDAEICSEEDRNYYQQTLQGQVLRITRCIYISFALVYISLVPLILLALLAEPRELLYLAWIPFDWQRDSLRYALAFGYQLFSLVVDLVQGVANDVFAPLTLCYMGGHIRLCGMRLARLGCSKEPAPVTYQKLRACWNTFRVLTRFHQLTREVISPVQFVQVVSCGANMCIVVSYILFYVRDTVGFFYNGVLFSVICLQLFPSCYYASAVAEQTLHLPYAVFSGNWYKQSARYRRNVLIFIQLTQQFSNRSMMAGVLMQLNLNTFFATVKMAYSLFAVVSRVKIN